jgi:predicted ABC-type transport system involved in lysophospholipase L1 biosynthesis ATPase subunit
VSAVLEITDVTKDYRGLRPLRIQQLRIAAGERVALLGFDQVTAELFVNLVTGATLPDSGEVSVFGRLTAGITDSDEWLRLADRFGIVSERAVLLGGLTALQNLAMPCTLNVEPLGEDARSQAEALAGDVALAPSVWDVPVAGLSRDEQMRIRLGRALALGPDVLLLEHVSAHLERSQARALANAIGDVVVRRSLSLVAIGADESFARAVARRVLRWTPATGRLAEAGWLDRLLG